MDKILTFVVSVLLTVAVFVLISLLLIKIGWGLFVVPVFGLQELTWLQAFGFSLLAASFRNSSGSKGS